MDDEMELKNNIKKRGIVKAKLTLFSKFLNALVALPNEAVDKVKLNDLESRIEKLPDILSEFEICQTFAEMHHDNLEQQLLERENFENIFYSLLASGRNFLAKHSDINESNEVIDSASQDGESVISESYSNRLQSAPKLPSIPIPKFHGNFDKWLEFRDTFKSLIHNNANISEIEKFHFLRGSLESNARDILQNLEITSDNYAIAWDILCERYDNESMLVNNYLKNLFGLPSMSRESGSDLRKLLDGIIKGIRSLEALKIKVDTWDIIIIYFMVQKLDPVTAREWEEHKTKEKLPSLDEFKSFLKSRAELLETLEVSSKENKLNSKHKSKSFVVTNISCPLCKHNHNIINCTDFLKLTTYERYECAKQLKLCLNCLKPNHVSKSCSAGKCRKCHNNHNTLLHYAKRPFEQPSASAQNTSGTVSEMQTASNIEENVLFSGVNTSADVCQTDTLLSTALVKVCSLDCKFYTCRVLLDSGSQSNFVTERLCQKLNLSMQKIDVSVIGINQVVSPIKYRCDVNIQSLQNWFKKTISCLVVPRITDCIPSSNLNFSHLNIPRHLKLADPNFGVPGPIDLLIGVDTFYQLLCDGQINLGENQPTVQKTHLGWILAGSFTCNIKSPQIRRCSFSLEIHKQLERFWAIEEPPNGLKPIMSNEDKECESIFINTTKRDKNGRFLVQIPLKMNPSSLGDSSIRARRQFFSLERRLHKNETMKNLYIDFMTEYENMGHMTLDTSDSSEISYFLPHHGVINDNSSTTRLRVVFNGSYPSDNGISLNDLQYTGPNIQEDILAILLRFREHNVVVSADVAKMYRMVLIDEAQQCLQKIYWRTDPNEELKIYKLNTVTYGTRSAAYLAIRCLKQLALEFEDRYPEACKIILRCFFVDDLLFGTDNVECAVRLSQEVAYILETAGFLLRKWKSNSSEVVEQITGRSPSSEDKELIFGEKGENKTLGLYWLVEDDLLRYHIDLPTCSRHTKRSILSSIAKIYDPLGLLSPCIVLAKIILQKLWSTKIGWDETLPSDIHALWFKLRQQLPILNQITVPRQMCENSKYIEIHGFCDSSTKAYGACLYLKTFLDNETKIFLVYAKARVAPLKIITLPRLELCGALVLAQLVDKFKESVGLNISKTYLWTDSSVVLGWLNQSPHNLHTFVGNRISQIQTLTSLDDWHHVSSKDNPADVVSRGLYPEDLLSCKHWWNGPEWLLKGSSDWPKSSVELSQLPEVKKHVNVSHIIPEMYPMERFSNFSRLKRSFAYLWRFYKNSRCNKTSRIGGPLSVEELTNSLHRLLLISQKQSFPNEYELLVQNKPCKKGPLSSLNPFIDSQGILRVGGRLQLSELDYAKKHPAVISCKHTFTRLLFDFEHKILLHAGPQHLLASLREHYWPIGGRNLARQTVHKCVVCFKVKPKPMKQIMGVLPKDRVVPSYPFNTVGIDYAGPFNFKTKEGRGAKILKCYVVLFVCFSTRAIHLEMVSDLTSEAFLATFRRFVSRRGKPSSVWSDNGLNFVGANSQLKELGHFLQSQSSNLVEKFQNEGIDWKFIPAKSPTFGGIWEAGVKACKFHMKRIMCNVSLTFENFYTMLTQIEATLNSRPLIPISSDPSDYDVLTPAHFLIGRRLTSIPDRDFQEMPESRLTKFHRVQKLYQHFWSRWSKEYVILLQQRLKWKHPEREVQLGELVIIREDNLPPLCWKLGRIIHLHFGPDKLCRVVTLKTASGTLKRSLAKICPLPKDNDY